MSETIIEQKEREPFEPDTKAKEKFEAYRTKVTIDPWRLKLYEFQSLIEQEQNSLNEMLYNLDPKKEGELPEDEQKTRKEEFRKNITKYRSNIKTLGTTIKEHRMNKNMSSQFVYIPRESGMNRSQARNFRRTKRK